MILVPSHVLGSIIFWVVLCAGAFFGGWLIAWLVGKLP